MLMIVERQPLRSPWVPRGISHYLRYFKAVLWTLQGTLTLYAYMSLACCDHYYQLPNYSCRMALCRSVEHLIRTYDLIGC